MKALPLLDGGEVAVLKGAVVWLALGPGLYAILSHELGVAHGERVNGLVVTNSFGRVRVSLVPNCSHGRQTKLTVESPLVYIPVVSFDLIGNDLWYARVSGVHRVDMTSSGGGRRL